jgi:dTDP-glucose 4,6-dehydratase
MPFSAPSIAMDKTVLVTGGAGFIGGTLIDRLFQDGWFRVACLDKLTYAGNRSRLAKHIEQGLEFVQLDLADVTAVDDVVDRIRPDLIFHLAAESHVDRSIDRPDPFITSNIVGTANLLNASLKLVRTLADERASNFRFIHVSTDEVFGSASPGEDFSETSPYEPRSPYAASKAAADHLVSAWQHTYALPAVISNCSNNYGPNQFPEKLIPHAIIRALTNQEIPIYGDGQHERDWIFVDDHVDGLLKAANQGVPGDKFLFGGGSAIPNLDLIFRLCQVLDELAPGVTSHVERIAFVPDRPGHDRRYSIDPERAKESLGWKATTSLDTGLRKTVDWYIRNEAWWRDLIKAGYGANRLGLNV